MTDADDVEVDRELFTRIAETHPGIVRTLSVLVGELADVDELEPSVLRVLSDRIRRIGDTLIARADRLAPPLTVIDCSNTE